MRHAKAGPDRYEFACARDLYAENVHPRVALAPDDLAEIRQAVKRGNGRKIMRALRQKVGTLADLVLASNDLPALLKGDRTHHSQAARICSAVADIAMVGVLDEDAGTIDALARVMDVIVHAEGRLHGRAGNLALAYDLVHDHLSQRQRRDYVRAARRQMEDLLRTTAGRHFRNAGGNVTASQTLQPLLIMLAVAGDPGAKNVRRHEAHLAKALEASVNVAINRDGYPEEDIGYGSDVAAWLVFLAEMASRAGVVDVFERCPRLLQFGRAMLHFVQPWGTYLSNTGDFGGGSLGRRDFALPRLAKRTDDPTLLWLLGTLPQDDNSIISGQRQMTYPHEVALRPGVEVPANWRTLLVLPELSRRARHPSATRPPTAYCDRRRGIVSFRSGWRDDDTLAIFDGSQRLGGAQGHAHASCGNFTLSAMGEFFAIDCGRYNNEQSSHNVVLIDGKSGRSTEGRWEAMKHAGALTHYEPGALVDFAAVDSSHQHNCYWARRYLGLVKPAAGPAYLWVIDDINKHDDVAEYWWQLHTSPENTIRLFKDHATITGWRCGNKLDVHFALPAPGEYPTPHRLVGLSQDQATLSSHDYIRNPHERAAAYIRPAAMLRYSAFVRPRLIARIQGYDGKFMSIMIPREKNGPKPRCTQLASLPSSLAVQICFERFTDTIIFAHEHDLLEAGEVQARGHWCFVRRDIASGTVVEWAARECTMLNVAGVQLLP